MEQAQHWVHEIVIDDQLLVERQRAPVPLCVTAEELPGRDNLFQCASSSVLPCEELHFQWLFPGSPKPSVSPSSSEHQVDRLSGVPVEV